MEEKFILLPFDNKYAVSNKGKILNVKSGRQLKTNVNKNGYEYVQLSTNGKRRTYRIHRLVAQCFISNDDIKPYINHIDGNKLNNDVTNLEWCTAKENDNHARNNNLKVQNKPIIATNIKTGCKIVFSSLSECARFLNTNKGSIHRTLKGKRKAHKGYTFTYL